MQHFLARASWDTDGVRDDLRDYVMGALGDADGVLVVDETGDLKKGCHSVGVQRQYTGTAGRIENAQVAVYLAYAGRGGHAMIDRELYLPARGPTTRIDWGEAGVPAEVELLTKPALATGMLTRALATGVAARWVTGDEVYGADPALRAELEAQPGRVRARHRLRPAYPDRRRAASGRRGRGRAAPTGVAAPVSRGRGEGTADYEWAWIDHTDREHRNDEHDTQQWSLLIRRHPDTGELAYYRCCTGAMLETCG